MPTNIFTDLLCGLRQRDCANIGPFPRSKQKFAVSFLTSVLAMSSERIEISRLVTDVAGQGGYPSQQHSHADVDPKGIDLLRRAQQSVPA